MVRVKIMPQETFIIIALYNVSSCSLNYFFPPSWTLPSLFSDGHTNECIFLINSRSLSNLSAHVWWAMVIALMRKWQCLFLAISHHCWKSQASDSRFLAFPQPTNKSHSFMGCQGKIIIKKFEIQKELHKIYRIYIIIYIYYISHI